MTIKNNSGGLVMTLLVFHLNSYSLPTLGQMLDKLKPIETAPFTHSQTTTMLATLGVAGTGWGVWSWYKNHAKAQMEKEKENEKNTFESCFQDLMKEEIINNDYSEALSHAIHRFIIKEDNFTIDFLNYVYEKILYKHFEDDRNVPSPLLTINEILEGKTGTATFLMIAAHYCHPKAIMWLLKKGANPYIKLKDNTVFSLAIRGEKSSNSSEKQKNKYKQILNYLGFKGLSAHIKAQAINNLHSFDCAMHCKEYYNKIL